MTLGSLNEVTGNGSKESVNVRRRENAGLDRCGNANLVVDRRDESDEVVENECERECERGGLKVRVLGRRRRVGHRPCVRKRDEPTRRLHTQERPCLCSDRLRVVEELREREKEKEKRTFSKDGEVDFDDVAVKSKDGLEMAFDDVSGEICDDDDLCVCVGRLDLHVATAQGLDVTHVTHISIGLTNYASSSTYLWRISFHSFYSQKCEKGNC